MSLINDLISEGYLRTPEIINAFRKINRADFMLQKERELSEINTAMPIGLGQTISQPATVAFMFEKIQPKKGERILDVGSGSGYTTALLSEIVGEKGRVYAIERIKELKEFGQTNTDKYGFVKSGRASFIYGDGTKGLPKEAPFDKILVSAAGEEIPEDLKNQLKIGGKLIIPVGEKNIQNLILITKIGEKNFKEDKFPGFVFVPLISK